MKTDSMAQFEARKQDHIRIALSDAAQTPSLSGFDRLRLRHEALPDLDFAKIQTETQVFGHTLQVPYLISSMTAGHGAAHDINLRLARLAQEKGWAMGVGSQRRELSDPEARQEWKRLRAEAPRAVLLGNLGIAQVISTPLAKIQELVENLQAQAFFVHLNPLQECFQPEGNLDFTGSWKALEKLVQNLSVPVLVKETGCGFSEATLRRLSGLGLYAVDMAGTGGTHWGRVEGLRSSPEKMRHQAAKTFENWGYSTVESLLACQKHKTDYKLWASGGVRSGLDAAKLIALGAEMVGFAKPILEAALHAETSGEEAGEHALRACMERFEFELKVALFCTGSANIQDLQKPGVWTWI